MKKPRTQWQIRLEYWGFLLLYRLVHAIPFKMALKLNAVLFHLLYAMGGKTRQRTLSHLKHAGVAKTDAEAEEIARKCYQEFGKLLVEIVKMDQMYDPAKIKVCGDPESIRRIISPDGVTPAETHAIVVTAHYGNWEVAGTAFADKTRHNMLSIMRPFSNPLIGEMILAHRRSSVHELVDRDVTAVRKLLRALQKESRHATLLIDQHAAHNEGVDTVFFGQPCKTHRTPAMLHLKTGIPIIPELTRRCGDDFSFELVLGPLIEYQPTGDKEHDIQTICQMCTTELEKLIAEKPEQWMWPHRRWTNINRDRDRDGKRI
ncbi:MAG: lysophospholipid acyltransferase family protein [Lentisphaeria bacterium]|nr:lysophospholipid acyltransferase family protein [Lentisphaeria bacterium]